jgi:hypothetical protein
MRIAHPLFCPCQHRQVAQTTHIHVVPLIYYLLKEEKRIKQKENASKSQAKVK